MNTPIDYSSRYSFGHFCCRVKQGKRLSEFLQKYTDSGTETTHLAGYNILVFKYVKILGPASTFYRGNSRTELKNQMLHNLAMFASNVLNNKCFRQIKHVRLWKNVILWAISRRKISPLVVIFYKKIDQPSCRRTTRRNYKHIPQIVYIIWSSRFRVLHLLSWEFERSEVLWRYTVILVCHLKHVEVGWATRNYLHTRHLS